MKVLALAIATLLSAPISSAYARSITIEISDDVTFENIKTYEDGTTIVKNPRVYGLPLSAHTIGHAEDNTVAFCGKIGMLALDNYTKYLTYRARAVHFSLGRDGRNSAPQFGEAKIVIETVICRL